MTDSSPASSKPDFVDSSGFEDDVILPDELLFEKAHGVTAILAVIEEQVLGAGLNDDQVTRIFDLAERHIARWSAPSRKEMWEQIASIRGIGEFGEEEAVRRADYIVENNKPLNDFYREAADEFSPPGLK